MRRAVYDQTRGYHEDFVFGEEELDLSYRAILNGFEITYAPDIVVEHYPEPPVVAADGRATSEIFYHARNRLFLAKQYLPAAYVAPYLIVWLARDGWRAVRERQVGAFLAGVYSGMRRLKQHHRTPLSDEAIAYLRANHGRLWF